jgi:hypothetical protein
MAEMTIRLRCDPVTGKRDIIVSLHTEHEQLHRQLVEKLVNGGIMKAGDKLIVERESQKGEAAQSPVGEPAPDQRRAQGEGA